MWSLISSYLCVCSPLTTVQTFQYQYSVYCFTSRNQNKVFFKNAVMKVL